MTALLSHRPLRALLHGIDRRGQLCSGVAGVRLSGEREGNREEFYILLLVATLGAMVLAASSHFVSFFLGLEILSVALYALIAYLTAARSRWRRGSSIWSWLPLRRHSFSLGLP